MEGYSLNHDTWVQELKEKRSGYGISQSRLAVAAGMTRQYLSDIETGKVLPSEELKTSLLDALERFNPDAPLEMLFDYVRIRFPTLDVKHVVEDILRLKLSYICKRAMDDERKDYMKALSRQSKRETLFSDMGDYLVSQFATVDSYPSDFHIFTLNDSTVGVESDLLSEALRNLTDKKREIILLYYFMDMNDTEIADLLKLNRSTVYRHRTSGLAFIKEFMEENEE